jgi:hypothetical protein
VKGPRRKVEGGRLFVKDGMVWRDAGPAPPRRRLTEAQREARHRARMDRWAARYDRLDGAPEGREDS